VAFSTSQVLHWPLARAGAFAATIRPLFAKLRANADQNKTLSVIRDTLLPKLMRGEIEAPDIEQATGRAV
jgi:type I restriction enzyme S subunit